MSGVVFLGTNVSTDATQDAINIPGGRGKDTGLLQVDITGTISVMIQGQIHPNLGWVDLLDSALTASDIVGILVPKKVRMVTTGTSGGTATAAIRL